jgi:UPF0755 protein
LSARYPRPSTPKRGGGLRTFFSGVGVLLLLLVIAGGGSAWYYNREVHAAHRAGQPATAVDIPPGTSTSAVADILARDGLIGSGLVFQVYVRVHGLAIEAGHYQVPGGLAMDEIAALLSHDQGGASVKVTIPEGYTAKQIGTLLEQKGLVAQAAFLAATHEAYPDDFLAGHDPAVGLDGYLFPDTYQFEPKTSAHAVVQVLLKHFGEKVPPDLRARVPAGTTLAQAVVMASIVEREGFFDKDRAAIAGVFYNRLRAGMPLQSDATVAYAKGQAGADISEEDKQLKSPYNTYLNPGLPPGGISNPGLASIQAAIQPQQVPYLYYLTDKDGKAHFSKTYPQHQQCQVNLSVCPTLP